MAKKKNSPCCRFQATVSIDERGQMVLPKDLREKMNIGAGDKLAIASKEEDGKTCCLFLIKAETLDHAARDIAGL